MENIWCNTGLFYITCDYLDYEENTGSKKSGTLRSYDMV